MKKFLCLLLATLLCFSFAPMAKATTTTDSIEELAVLLINDALRHPEEFGLPSLSGDTVYLCQPIHPYTISEGELIQCNDIEYYLVKTEVDVFACITLCYENGEVASISLNNTVAKIIRELCNINEEFQIVTENGVVYIKTLEGVLQGTTNAQITDTNTDCDDIIATISAAPGTMTKLMDRSELVGIVSSPAVARSSRILSVPYVSQEGLPICWAAAAAAFGRYYTGDTYARYSASELAAMIGVGNRGATISEAQTILSSIFHIGTTYYLGRLSNSVMINLFQQGKPILATFYGHYNDNPSQNEGHMVVLCGYNDNNTGVNTIIYIRDSNSQSLMSVISTSNTELKMEYYPGLTMYWVEGAY